MSVTDTEETGSPEPQISRPGGDSIS